MSRIALIGSGRIARLHADALTGLKGHRVTAHRVTVIVDPDIGTAERLARAVGGAQVFASTEAALAADLFDRAHLLVPPVQRAGIGEQLLRAGKPSLLEAPLAGDLQGCARLLEAAGQTPLGANLNFVHHPAFVRLHARLVAGDFGIPTAITCTYAAALPELAARRFGHWRFHRPANLLLDQAIHPLSQLITLAGSPSGFQLLPGPAIEIAPGLPFVAEFTAILDCPVPVQFRFAVGQGFPVWQVTVTGSDGIGTADILNDRCFAQTRTRWTGAADTGFSGIATGGSIAWQAAANLAATIRRRGRRDAVSRSMQASLGAFHTAVDAGRSPALDGHFAASLVELCESIAAEAMPPAVPRPAPVPPASPAPAEIAVLGGTGFIGTHLVQRLVAAGRRVVVMARTPCNLPAVFDDPLVRIERGSIVDGDAVARTIAGCRTVVNLAHGGAGDSFEDMRHAMVGGAETVARACRDSLARRLIHVGSIAALYLGPQRAAITGQTPPDPRAAERGAHARAKALCDRMLLHLHHGEGLPVVILRPGIVIGQGASPFHPALGRFAGQQHCLGWNRGRNPLPFVLVEDVAEAILRACDADGIDGQCYNLVGDVRPSARAYIAELASASGRPLRFHPRMPSGVWLREMASWAVSRAAGQDARLPTRRDLLSRGMRARFDCTDARQDLGWRPNADAAHFRHCAILALA